jgi:hypothetical protein
MFWLWELKCQGVREAYIGMWTSGENLIISRFSLCNIDTWFCIAHCLLRTEVSAPQSGMDRIIDFCIFYHSIILTSARFPFLPLGGFGPQGLAVSYPVIAQPGFVMSKQNRFVFKV